MPSSSLSTRLVAPGGNATDHAYATVLGWIESREIGPGLVLDERRLAAALNISRTPLRNALNRLLGEGYLTRLANGTLMVREIDVGEVLELLSIRRMLEPEAVLLAASRIPGHTLAHVRAAILAPSQEKNSPLQVWQAGDALHDIVCDYCSNRSLANILRDARRRIRISAVEQVPGRKHGASQEHLHIIDALIAGQAQQAGVAMRQHLENITEGFLALYAGKQPGSQQ